MVEIVRGEHCGITVDPMNLEEIVLAINTILNDKKMQIEFSINGTNAVRNKYNWGIEEKKLLAFYNKI